MAAIFKRELGSYFSSAIGYVFLAIFYFFSGFYFFAGVLTANSSDLSIVFESMFMIVMFIIPILTMRLFSEEFRGRTDQLLLTSPVSLNGLVYGKFLAAYIMFAIGAAVTILYAVIIACFVPISIMEIVGNIIGILLLGGALISIGVFVSSLTKSQVVAAIGSFGVFLLFMYLDVFAQYVPFDWMQTVLNQISFMGRYRDFTAGLLNIADILYFISVIVIFNFLTVRMLEKKRWS